MSQLIRNITVQFSTLSLIVTICILTPLPNLLICPSIPPTPLTTDLCLSGNTHISVRSIHNRQDSFTVMERFLHISYILTALDMVAAFGIVGTLLSFRTLAFSSSPNSHPCLPHYLVQCSDILLFFIIHSYTVRIHAPSKTPVLYSSVHSPLNSVFHSLSQTYLSVFAIPCSYYPNVLTVSIPCRHTCCSGFHFHHNSIHLDIKQSREHNTILLQPNIQFIQHTQLFFDMYCHL